MERIDAEQLRKLIDEIAELVAVSTSTAHRRYQKALAMLGDMINGELAQPE